MRNSEPDAYSDGNALSHAYMPARRQPGTLDAGCAGGD